MAQNRPLFRNVKVFSGEWTDSYIFLSGPVGDDQFRLLSIGVPERGLFGREVSLGEPCAVLRQRECYRDGHVYREEMTAYGGDTSLFEDMEPLTVEKIRALASRARITFQRDYGPPIRKETGYFWKGVHKLMPLVADLVVLESIVPETYIGDDESVKPLAVAL